MTPSDSGHRFRRAVAALRGRGHQRELVRHPAASFVFLDLVGYTALTEQCGDWAAAQVASAFQRAVSTLSREHKAVHVKSMGDGAMVWAPDATRALELAARAICEIGTRPDLLPVRVGVHSGPSILEHGDWYGGAVNLASRLAQIAEPNEALVTQATVTEATRSALNGNQATGLTARREINVRGLAHQVTVWGVTAAPLSGCYPKVTGSVSPRLMSA